MKSFMLFLVTVCGATALAAQQPQPPGGPDSAWKRRGMMYGPMMYGPMMHGPMMHHDMAMLGGLMAFTPQYLLERKEMLGLSAQQVTRLEGLRDAAKPAHDRAASTAKAAGDSLQAALAAATPDTVMASRLFRAHHTAMGEAHWSMLKTATQAKAVLTETQRARVQGWADAMHDGPHMRDGHH